MKGSTPGWQTSSYTQSEQCVEARRDHGAVRDTKHRAGPALAFGDGRAFAGLVRFARLAAPVAAAIALVAAVSSVEYAPPGGQNWRPAAASALTCRCAPPAAPDYVCTSKTCW